MADRKEDAGTIQALLKRLNKHRMPRLLALQRKVENGDVLDDADARFLRKALDDAGDVMRLADRNPQIQPLVAQVAQLYNDISRKALENEEKAAGTKR